MINLNIGVKSHIFDFDLVVNGESLIRHFVSRSVLPCSLWRGTLI
jgi:hypothetical protein